MSASTKKGTSHATKTRPHAKSKATARMGSPRSSGVKWGCYSTPHPSSVIPVTHHANSAQSKACLRRPGLHPGRKQDRRALPYNPLLPPRAQEAGTEELSLPPELRLLAEVVQGFAPPGTPFVTASADKPGSRPLTCRDAQGDGGSKERAALFIVTSRGASH